MVVHRCPDAYSGASGTVTWVGAKLTDKTMEDLTAGPLRERAVDAAFQQEVAAEMQALDATDMASEVLAEFLATDPAPLDWQVGEALAEVLLQEWHGATWVWNGSRDRKTAKASLPGADVVGFIAEGGAVHFLFGEVKSSSDAASPPGVVYGRTGLLNQLEHLCAGSDHWTLIKWLRARCMTPEDQELFRSAMRRYVLSEKKDIRLVGCLVRDTEPKESDIKGRATALAPNVGSPMRAHFYVWYVPMAMSSWPTLLVESTS